MNVSVSPRDTPESPFIHFQWEKEIDRNVWVVEV